MPRHWLVVIALACSSVSSAALAIVISVLTSSGLQAASLTVDARQNIFAAGSTSPPPVFGGGGLLPAVFEFTTHPSQVLEFSSVTGEICYCSTFHGPDGGIPESAGTDLDSYGGISGIINANHLLFLVGAFLDENVPTDPSPPRLDFSNNALSEDFDVLTPLLAQTFFIGDGRNSVGEIQQFVVPPTATRLFLGFADGQFFKGQPNSYGDNRGSLKATFEIRVQSEEVPEPSTVWLIGLGVLALGSRRVTARRVHIHSIFEPSSIDRIDS